MEEDGDNVLAVSALPANLAAVPLQPEAVLLPFFACNGGLWNSESKAHESFSLVLWKRR